MVGTYAQHVPGGGSSDGGPGTGFGTAFGSPNAGAMLQHTSNKIHKISQHPTIYSKPKTNKTHTTFKNCCFRLRLLVVGDRQAEHHIPHQESALARSLLQVVGLIVQHQLSFADG